MRLKPVLSWAILACFLSTPLYAKTNAPANSENRKAGQSVAQQATQEAAQRRGTLYRVGHQGNTAYLFGTIHVGKEGISPLEGEVKTALAGADRLVLEIDIDKGPEIQGAVNKYGMYAQGDSLDRHLTPDTLSKLQTVLEMSGIPLPTVTQMKPWFIANMLLASDLMKSGLHPDKGADAVILAAAKAQKKSFEALETVDYQLSLFGGMSETQQELFLRETMSELTDGSATEQGMRLMDAWAGADGAALDGLLDEMTNEKTISANFLKQVFIEKRNVEMAAKLEKIIKKNKSTFVGVGWLHLVGEDGIPKLLKQKGFKVEKIY